MKRALYERPIYEKIPTDTLSYLSDDRDDDSDDDGFPRIEKNLPDTSALTPHPGDTLQHTATHTATHCNALQHTATSRSGDSLQHTVTHTATNSSALQHTATSHPGDTQLVRITESLATANESTDYSETLTPSPMLLSEPKDA